MLTEIDPATSTFAREGGADESKNVRGGPISRVLSGATIYLLTPSPAPSSALPERSAGHTIALLHAFAPEGACQAAVLPRRWWSLTPPFQLFSHPHSGQRESSFLRRFPSGYPARPLTCFLPCGARTFLMNTSEDVSPRSPGPPRACHCSTSKPPSHALEELCTWRPITLCCIDVP